MGRRRFSFRKQQIEEPSVDLTPLIDIVFCILIMFIVIAPLLELDRVELANANQNPGKTSVKDAGPISIHVKENNTIMLNHQNIAIDNLCDFLKQEKLLHPTATPQLYHDKRASFGTYQTIKNAAEIAGFDQLDLILKPS